MGQKASIVSRGKMSQKSISSFFTKSVPKKLESKPEPKKDVENPAKTKACQDKSSLTEGKKSGCILDAKENNKDFANKEITSVQNDVSSNQADSPPHKKTARNPAFKRKKEEEDQDKKNGSGQ